MDNINKKDSIVKAIEDFMKVESIPDFGTLKLVFKNGRLIYIGKEVTVSINF